MHRDPKKILLTDATILIGRNTAMISMMSIEQAQNDLPSLPDRFDRDPDLIVSVTCDGKPTMALLSREHYESLIETLEVMADADLMSALRQSAKDVAEGRTTDWESVKAKMHF